MAVGIQSDLTVEATSLASVLHLAANPPAEPTSSLLAGAPLILYIARVPGSRDVFLTPIKPREKVVTASDVQSSLYYVHIHSTRPGPHSKPSTELAPPTLPQRPVAVTKQKPPLPRRPVPPSSPPSSLDEFSSSTSGFAGGSQQISRKPPVPARSKSRALPTNLQALPSRPLPPTPPQEQVEQFDSYQHVPEVESHPSLHEDNVRLLRGESHIEEIHNPYVKDYSYEQEQLQLLELDCRPGQGTLTVIRRDPGSNEQWNVATIHDPPIPEISSSSFKVPTAKRRTKKGGAPLFLDILNPGYDQFIEPLARTESQVSATSTTSSEEGEPPSEGFFRRRIYMPGSKYAEHGYSNSQHRKQSSTGVLSSIERNSSIPSTLRNERNSVDMDAFGGSPRADPRARGYTFKSPWGGQCEFVTGATGRTLKCRHHLMPTSDRPARSVEVSELRFNLPSPTKSTVPALFSPRSSYFSQRPHLFDSLSEDGSQSPTMVINEDGRIDLTLGQEKAGGGFGGKQAKLGKLIIEPEGFGMLDLLVASNVGLWFRAWERS